MKLRGTNKRPRGERAISGGAFDRELVRRLLGKKAATARKLEIAAEKAAKK